MNSTDELATSLWLYTMKDENLNATSLEVSEKKNDKKALKAAKFAAKTAAKPPTPNEAVAGDDKNVKKVKKEKSPEIKYVDQTPKGQKKILTNEFPATYQPAYVESAWQSWWEESGFYKPNFDGQGPLDDNKKFVMVIPPPNVTGSLHLGHALTSTIEDTLTRWYRMKGYVTLWVPGVDHAGIATQSVVEKRLYKVLLQYYFDSSFFLFFLILE